MARNQAGGPEMSEEAEIEKPEIGKAESAIGQAANDGGGRFADPATAPPFG